MTEIKPDLFLKELILLLEETFDNVKGIYLDGGTSLFETLGKVDALTASRPAVEGGTTIAGHVEHMRWYLEITEDYLSGKKYEGFDWKTTWQVSEVTDEQWADLIASLRTACAHVIKLARSYDDWNEGDRVAAMMGVLAHTAYHLGAIRQMVKAVQA